MIHIRIWRHYDRSIISTDSNQHKGYVNTFLDNIARSYLFVSYEEKNNYE